jgi:hypothetical protein
MPGTDLVEELTFESVTGTGNFTIVGASNDFDITSGNFTLTNVGTLTVQGAAGSAITGDLDVSAVGATADAQFNIGNLGLDDLTVDAGRNADIGYSGLGSVAPAARTTVTLGQLDLTAGGTADFRIDSNTRTDFTVARDLDVDAVGNAAVTVDGNTLSTLTVAGNVEVTSIDANATLNLGDGADATNVGNSGSTITVTGGVDLRADDVASFSVNGNANSVLVDSAVTVTGNIGISALGRNTSIDGAVLEVLSNTRTNVSLADGGLISLEACGTDDNVRVTVAGNTNNFLPDFGNPDQAAVTNRSYALNLGAIQADAGEDAVVSLTDNDDDTYYGDLSVTIDSVDLFAYRNAALRIGGATTEGNNSATIVIGTVDMASQRDGTLAVTNNDGTIYVVTEPAFGTRREVDFADITIGNITIDADAGNVTDTGFQGDASVTFTGNDLARVTVETIGVDAGGDATFRVDDNNDTTVTTLGVTINAAGTATPTLTFSISDNDRVDSGAPTVPPLVSSVTINGDVTLTAPSTTTVININDNDGLSATARSMVTVNGSFTSSSGGLITATINDNDLATINLGGNATAPVVNLTSTAGGASLTLRNNVTSSITLAAMTLSAQAAASVLVGETSNGSNNNQDSTVNFASLGITSTASSAAFEVLHNNGDLADAGTVERTAVNVTGRLSIDGSTTSTLAVADNANVDVDLALAVGVTIDSRATGTGDAAFNVSGNTASTVEIGTVDIDAADAVSFDVRTNSDTLVRTGVIDINAGGAASFAVVGNTTSTTVELAVTRNAVTGAVTNRGDITMNAATVGSYASGTPASWGVDVSNNASNVYLGDLSITADRTVNGDINDVTVKLSNDLATNVVDVGHITVAADSDVYFLASNVSRAASTDVLRTGDITLTSGLAQLEYDSAAPTVALNPNVSSDLYFVATWLEGNDLNDNANLGDNGQQITLTANSRGTGEGYVYANISNAPDLTTLTVQGTPGVGRATNSEVYLTGDIGVDTAGTSEFTLDLSGLTGAFAGTASSYDPLGITANDNRAQADGSYVETWNANFGGDIVRVEIGSGGLIYNANYSNFTPTSSGVGVQHTPGNNFWGAPWDASEAGWFSLGTGGDFTPIVQTQTINLDNGNTGSGNNLNWAIGNTLSLDYGSATYTFTVGTGSGELLLTGANSLSIGDTGLTVKLVASSDSFVITGTPDGAAFTPISQFTAVVGSNTNQGDNSNNGLRTVSSGQSTIVTNDPAEDNQGQSAKEVFVFTGDSVGEVVIGGFAPGLWGEATNPGGRLTDRLDFSQFDWNGDGTADLQDAGLVNLSYFSFSIDDSDGYFKDVKIDFIGGANLTTADVNFGEIRLVGVGEYDNAVQLVQQSVIFA